MLEILDSLIATIGVVLVLSLVVQSIQQIIKQVGSFKSSYMERELFAMFHQPDVSTRQQSAESGTVLQNVANTVFQASLQSAKWVYEAVTPTSVQFKIQSIQDNDVNRLVEAIKTKVAGLGYNDLSLLETMKKADFGKLLEALPEARERLDEWKRDVETWYDLTLKSFQDHYERKMKGWAYLLSFLVVVWLDANIFEIQKEFSSNKVLRDSAVKMAERLTSIPKDSLIVVTSKGKKDSLQQKADTMALKAIEKQIARIDSLVNANSYQVMRWNTPKGDRMRFGIFLGFRIWPLLADIGPAIEHNLFGWLAMALLVGLGAPFWYDFLKSIMGIKDVLKSKSQLQQ
jgi:hypothetical protein